MMIPFAGQYTREEWLKGLNLAMRPNGRQLILRAIAVLIFFLAVGLTIHSLTTEQNYSLRSLRHAITGTLLLIWAVAPFVQARISAERTWRSTSGRVSLKGVATHEGLATNASSGLEKWDSYLRLIRRDDMVILMGSDGLATILPKRFFKSENDWEDFVQYAGYKVILPR